MKIIILCLSLFVYSSGAVKYYVDKDAAGTGSGLSWVNAAKKVSSLPWASLVAGDTVFISGGTVSKTYNKDQISSKIVTNGVVVVTKGKDAGHNGEVVFAQTSPIATETWLRYTFGLNACQGIKLTGLTFTTLVNNSENGAYILGLGNGQNNIVENCKIISNGNGYCVYLSKETKATISNNIITVEPNTLQWGQDAINGGGGGGGHTITGNKLTMGGSVYSENYHKDMIQFHQEGATNNFVTTIANNFFYYNSEYISVSGIMYLAGVLSNIYYIYNNVMVTNVAGVAEVVIYPYNSSYNLSAHVYNNTMITGEESSTDPFVFGDLDTLDVKNNIVVMDSISSGADIYTFIQSAPGSIPVKSIDYNHYSVRPKGVKNNFSGQAFSTWKGLGYDTHSDTGVVSFTNMWGTNSEDYITTIGRDKGTTIPQFDTDIRNKHRPQGATWDKGALEYVSGSSGGGDITPPRLLRAVINNPASIELTFSEPMNVASAVNILNYSINNGITVYNAAILPGGLKVNLTTSNHSSGNYLVTTNNVKDTAGNAILPGNNTASYLIDVTPPIFISITVQDSVRLELAFSEILDSVSVQNAANYLISNNIVVLSARLSSNLYKVNLVTTPHAAGQTYTITVNNVRDPAGNPMASNSKQYTYLADTTAPDIMQVTVTSSKSLTINFTEKLDPAKANNKSNYVISNNITIRYAQLLPDSSSVRLETFPQKGTQYTLTISNITDRAGNTIKPNPKSVLYNLPNRGTGNIILYSFETANSGTWTQNYSPEKTIDGEGMNHPDSRWISNRIMPDTISFNTGISRPLDSMRVSFYNWETCSLYKYSVYSSVDSINWHPVVENIWSDTLEWTEIEFDSLRAKFMKLILLESNKTPKASIWEIKVYGRDEVSGLKSTKEAPLSYALSQNYPNPFNPSTRISVTLPQQARIRLAVYNVLGELVTELANADYSEGSHEFDFNAEGLASGIYIYRIESTGFTETKKMMLLR